MSMEYQRLADMYRHNTGKGRGYISEHVLDLERDYNECLRGLDENPDYPPAEMNELRLDCLALKAKMKAAIEIDRARTARK